MAELLTESIKMNDFAFLSEAEIWEKYTSTKYSVPGSRQTGVCRIAILFSRNEAQLWPGVRTRQVYWMLWALPSLCDRKLDPVAWSKPCCSEEHTYPHACSFGKAAGLLSDDSPNLNLGKLNWKWQVLLLLTRGFAIHCSYSSFPDPIWSRHWSHPLSFSLFFTQVQAENRLG